MFHRSFNKVLLLTLLLPSPNTYSMADSAKVQKKIAKVESHNDVKHGTPGMRK